MYAMPIDLNFVEPAENRLLSPEKFEPIYVPSVPGSSKAAGDASPANPFPLPSRYAASLRERGKRVTSLMQTFASVKGDEAQRVLQSSVHNAFREWLVSSGHSRNIMELMRIHNSEGA